MAKQKQPKVIKSFGHKVTDSKVAHPKPAPHRDYNELRYKHYANVAKIGIDFNEERFPKGAKVPNFKKYDKNGKYIKHTFIATKRPSEEGKIPKVGLGTHIRDNAISNPAKGKYKRVTGKK